MKRSFYEVLRVPHNADTSQIDTAYALATEKLKSSSLRGTGEAAIEAQLIRDGYQILSDPAKRAKYDAKIAAAESGVQLMFFPEDRTARFKVGLQIGVFAAVATLLAGLVYSQFTHKMDEVRVDYQQTVTKKKEDLSKVITIDAVQSESSVASGNKAQKQ
jgi:DnaJ-class molecular chaperone